MISYLGSLVHFSPAPGRAGRCRQTSLCVDSTPHVPATLGLPCTGVSCAFPVYTAQAPGCSIWSGPCVECGSSFRVLHKSTDSVAPVLCVFSGLRCSGSQGLGRTVPGYGAPFPFQRVAWAARGLGSLSPDAARLFPPLRAARAARGLGALSTDVARLFPPRRAVRAARGLGALSPDAARLFPPQRAARASRGLGALSPGAVRLFPPRRAARASRGLGALSPGAARLFPPQ